jgi:cell division transport system ATP-binding protein
MSELVVQLDNVNIYQSGSLILQDVNLKVEKGEFVYLVGRTGAGKSSLLKTLYGELTLTEGNGNVVGFNLKRHDLENIAFS